MRQILLLLTLVVITQTLSAQKNIYTIKADSVKITNCDSSELIIENHTQGINGFLYNTGNGRTKFQRGAIRISDTAYQVGGDTLHIRYPNAWIQGGNSFGANGILGTNDFKNLDLYSNHSLRMRVDSLGSVLVGFTSNSGYLFDVNGATRIYSPSSSKFFNVSCGDAYDISLRPLSPSAMGTSTDMSLIDFGNTYASIGIVKQALGVIPAGSLIMGGSSSGRYTTMVDGSTNPMFIADGSGAVVINGGYRGINTGGSNGYGTDYNSYNLTINGGRGTGAGLAGDIVFSTGTSQASGTSIHPMTARWYIKGNNGNLSNNSTPTSMIDITGTTGYSQFRMRTTYTPSSSSDTNGNTGDFSWDSNYLYVKTASGWKRAALSTF